MIKTALIKIKKGDKFDISTLSRLLNINIDKLRGYLEEWKKKKFVVIYTIPKTFLTPGETLLNYGVPPEVKILEKLLENNRKIELNTLLKSTGLHEIEYRAGISILITERLVVIRKEDAKRYVQIIDENRSKEYIEALKKITDLLLKHEKISYDRMIKLLSPFERNLLEKLMKRQKIIQKNISKDFLVEFMVDGYTLMNYLEEVENVIKDLSKEVILSGEWKKKKFKEYNIRETGYYISPGRRHPLRELIEEIREIFFELGFEEVEGPLIESSFVNFDMLFQPQDHPARDMQDTFYLKEPKVYDEVPFPELIDKIRKVHESGGDTGSIGWRYKWSLKEAKKLVLRTHTTAVTIRNLYLLRNRDKMKLFTIGRVFRNETIDYKHLADFMQVDGIYVDRNANLRLLMGLLEYVFKKLGAEKVKFWPTYFPFTEPSVQPTIYSSHIGEWIELGGAGIFRPEITKPLGIKNPVLAWGLGLERIVMIKYGINDIREIYLNKLSWLRNRVV